MKPSAMGRRVKQLRETQGMTQRALADKATVTQGLIHQLETGVIQDVRSQVVMKLAKALGVPVTGLLE